ncbi:FtsW/RodA/SpoVE family cell cycle protein [Caulobacter sp. 73W]|uniref:FtsW/RodA/SpoVE family cell cycle protein n=1 Tax=Caulobacter sp. 73W TaxID=3161137 RepID=A0AB39KXL2_9CAUL
MNVAERIIRCLCRFLPPALHDWGEAMAHEAASIQSPLEAIGFALSCGIWVVREALVLAFLSLFTRVRSGPSEGPARRMDWEHRKVALACAIAASSLGLVHLAEVGAPRAHIILNLTSLIAGLIIVLPFRRIDLAATPFVSVAALATGLILLLTAAIGDEAFGARRWLSLGGVVIQPSLISLPFLAVAFARSRDRLTNIGVVCAAVAMALQPDHVMAGALVAGLAVGAVMKRDRSALLTFAIALACFVVTILRPSPISAAPFVTGVSSVAGSTSLLTAPGAWGCIALLLPSILGLSRRRGVAAYATFGMIWLALITMALVADYPLPVITYGGSAIVGYLWSILALPAETSVTEHCSRATRSPLESPIDRKSERLGVLRRLKLNSASPL